jgi:hypothetical protein
MTASHARRCSGECGNARQDGVLRIEHGAVELGELGLPEVERLGWVAGMRRQVGIDELRRDGLRWI